jgi:hypothetical protein
MLSTLAHFLRTLAGINIQLAGLTNQAAKHSILARIKDVASMCSTDYADVADYIDECIGYAELSVKDVDTLRRVSERLRKANELLHAVQDSVLLSANKG